jgi:hypothetical protein
LKEAREGRGEKRELDRDGSKQGCKLESGLNGRLLNDCDLSIILNSDSMFNLVIVELHSICCLYAFVLKYKLTKSLTDIQFAK